MRTNYCIVRLCNVLCTLYASYCAHDKFDKGAHAHTYTRHKPSIHIFQPPPRSLTLSNAFLRLRRKKALDGKNFSGLEYGIFGEGSQISANQRLESTT